MTSNSLPRTVSLRNYTTLRIGGPAELWQVNSIDEIREATVKPFKVLGGGSNLLVSDEGVSDRVIKLGQSFSNISAIDGTTDVWIGAATPLPGLVRRAQRQGVSGLEGLFGIPGVVGGAIAMNAGTRFGSIADTLTQVEVFIEGNLCYLSSSELGLAYRTSNLPPNSIVVRARLQLVPSQPQRVARAMASVDEARRGQPNHKSAGCAFKNPPGKAAGFIIDQAGLKGLRVGDAMISHQHGNFIVNLGSATQKDVLELIAQVRSRVEIPLELEWRGWG